MAGIEIQSQRWSGNRQLSMGLITLLYLITSKNRRDSVSNIVDMKRSEERRVSWI